MYKFNSKLNKKTLSSSSKYLIPNSYKAINYIAAILFLVLAGFMVYTKDYIFAVLLAIFALAFMIMPLIKAKQMASRIIKSLKETYGKEEIIYDITMREDSILVENTNSKGLINISYNDIKQFKILDNHYLLLTKTRNFFMLDKRSLDQEKRTDFMKFIQRKLPQIKWTKVIGK